MRFARLLGARHVAIETADRPPTPGPRQVLVEIDACGVSGSDRTAFETGRVPGAAWFGHEWSGRIVAAGSDTGDHFIGRTVVAGVAAPCGTCDACRSGRGQHCRTVLEQIVGLDEHAGDTGGFATHVVADGRRVVPVLDGLDVRDAVMVGPTAVAAHAVGRSGLALGDRVVVVGGGTIGLLVAEVCRIRGAAEVVVVDPGPARRELACDLGADAAIGAVDDAARSWLLERTGGLGADVVFVCVDSSQAMGEAISLVASGGVIVAVGVGDRIDNLSIRALLVREADFRVSLGYTRADVDRVQMLIQQSRLRVRDLVHPDALSLESLEPFLAAGDQRESARPKRMLVPTPRPRPTG